MHQKISFKEKNIFNEKIENYLNELSDFSLIRKHDLSFPR